MKHKKAVLLGLMGLFLAGGIGTSLALTYGENVKKDITGNADSAVYLKWGEAQDVTAVTDLKTNEPQFRTIIVDASRSANEKEVKSVDVTFGLATKDVNTSINGLTVAIYTSEKAPIKGDVSEMTDTTKVLKAGATTNNVNIDFTGKTSFTYYIRLKINYDGSQAAADGAAKTIGGKITYAMALVK